MELTQRSGVSRSMLSRIENGQVSPSIESLHRLADAPDIPISRLFAEQRCRTDFSHVPSGKGLRVDRASARCRRPISPSSSPSAARPAAMLVAGQ